LKTHSVRVVYAHNGGFFDKIFQSTKPVSVVRELVTDLKCSDPEIVAIRDIGMVVYVGGPV